MIIDRYIGRAVLSGTMLTLLVFGSLFAFIEFVGELENVGTNEYSVLGALAYTALNLPMRLYQIFPTTILLGGLLSLGAMASNSELVVVRAAGISTLRIMRSVAQAGILLVVVVVLLGEFVAPLATETAKTMRAKMIEGNALTSSRAGFWSKSGNRYIQIGTLLPELVLQDVLIFDHDVSGRLSRSTYAAEVSYDDDRWILSGVRHSEIHPDGIRVSEAGQEIWPAVLSPELFDVLNLLPLDMSASELFSYSRYLDENKLDSAKYWLAFWVKVFTPVTCLGMLLLTIPLVMAASSRSGSSGYRILIGVFIGVGFFVLNRVVNEAGILYGMPPFISAGLLPVLVAVAAVLMIRRVR